MIIDKIAIILKDIIELGGAIAGWINTNIVGIIGNAIKPAGLFIIKILEFIINAIRIVINKI